MPAELSETLWLHGQSTISLAEIAEASGLPELELRTSAVPDSMDR
ncbi:MAG: hypothetical protein WCI11_17000 [Candidatus Methylumidiphilus sp.]